MGWKTGNRLVLLSNILDQKLLLFSTLKIKSPINIVLSLLQVNRPYILIDDHFELEVYIYQYRAILIFGPEQYL